ncbi:hypothetical protein HKX48_008263, partial [Thoreauomyces humboldtii]
MLRLVIRHSPDDLLATLYLSSNSIAPSYKGVELGVGPQILIKAITSISDFSPKRIKAVWDACGDWGDVVVQARRTTRMLIAPKPLTVAVVFATLQKIAELKGQGTVGIKTELVKKLMVASQGEELRFLTRTMVSHLRIGAVRTTILTALGHAVLLEHSPTSLRGESLKLQMKAAEQTLKECYAQVPSYDVIVPLLMDRTVGLQGIADACRSCPGIPIRPMLGKITKDLTEIYETMEGLNFSADFKYD